ncbi:MAG: transketolase [Pseudomonadota bacterium]
MSDIAHADLANAVRALSMDAVEAAKSGHPGMPMGMADVATVLFGEVMRFDAAAPDWPDRDRFVLSAGHGSMLIYALAYLLGYEGMAIEDIKNFRQLGAKTAGHPEFGHAPAVETTTGPLGQGLGNAVGMAIAEAHLAARYGSDLVNHRTYVIAGDGCLMEGISQEAISLAGHLKLNKLIVLWDDNGISIDGPVSLSDSTDQLARFEASGWSCSRIDGHDPDEIRAALKDAQTSDRPVLIACRTTIGKGAPTKAGKASSHGAPLGADEIAGARDALGWPHAPFEIPEPILSAWRGFGARGAEARSAWEGRLAASDRAALFKRALSDADLPNIAAAISDHKRALAEAPAKLATRKASQSALEAINAVLPTTIGGSADLTGSNNTKTGDLDVLTSENYAGRYLHYGIREHGMAAAMNGMALHGGVVPYGATFLVFTDYCRPAIRLSALMQQRVIYVMTHDSIGLGEDGPTHQPVEHLAALRAIPGLHVFRPADAVETAECWQAALETTDAPSVIALTRQGLQPLRTTHTDDNLCARGAYELSPADGAAQATLFATGSEVEIALAAQALLKERGVPARVVSVPCWSLFDAQPADYRAAVIGDAPMRLAIEAGVRLGWDKYVGERGLFVGMESFGASAPAGDLFKHFGITAERAADMVIRTLADR